MIVIIFIIVSVLYYHPRICVSHTIRIGKKYILKSSLIYEMIFYLLIFCIALLLRLLAVFILKTQPVSDFFFAHDNASKLVSGILDPVWKSRYSQYTSWGIWSLTIYFVYSILGINHFYIQIINCLLQAFTTILIYNVTKNIIHSSRIGVLAAILFLFNPTMVMYCSVLSAEHIVMFLCPVLLLAINKYWQFYTYKNCKGILIYGLIIGIIIAVINIYRPIGIVFLIAFVICNILYQNMKIPNRLKSLSHLIIVLGLMIACNVVVSKACNIILKNTMGIEGSINQGYSFGRMLLIGVGIDDNGNYSKQIAREFTANYKGELEDFNKACLKEAVWHIKTHYNKYPKVFYEKICTAFGRPGRYPETGFTTWIYQSKIGEGNGHIDEEHPFFKEYFRISSVVLGQYYVIIMFFAMLGCFYFLYKKCEPEMCFVALFILGFTLILVLGEANGRYKSVLFPFISILASLGIWNIYQIVKEMFYKHVI